MEAIEKQLTELVAELKATNLKREEEVKNIGVQLAETKAARETLAVEIEKLHTQLDAIDAKMQQRVAPSAGAEKKSVASLVLEHPDYLEAKSHDFTGRKPVTMHLQASAFQRPEVKTTITDATVGFATSGVLLPMRLPGVTELAKQEFRLRDLIPAIEQTEGSSFDFVTQNTRTNATSPQVEGNAKAESTYLWTTASDQIRTIAHFTNVSRQALSDLSWMQKTLNSELIYGLQLKEENEILFGAGTGVHLNGIATQATAFNTALYNTGSWQRIDQLRKAKLQARLAGLATYRPSGYVLNPADLEAIELTKDSYGRYIVGQPMGPEGPKFLWDLPIVESDSMAAGSFLVGAFNTAVTLIDRMATTVEISYEHASNFTANLATILCEERVGLAVRVPGAFVYGNFSTSPAGQ